MDTDASQCRKRWNDAAGMRLPTTRQHQPSHHSKESESCEVIRNRVTTMGRRFMNFSEALAYQSSWTADDREVVKTSLAQHFRREFLHGRGEWMKEHYGEEGLVVLGEEFTFHEIDDPDGAGLNESLKNTLVWIELELHWYIPASGGYVGGGLYDRELQDPKGDFGEGFRTFIRNLVYFHGGHISLRDTYEDLWTEVELSGRKRSSALAKAAKPENLFPVCESCWLTHPPGPC